MKTPYEYFYEAAICETVAQNYDRLGLIANAHYFKERTIFMIAKGLEVLALRVNNSRVENSSSKT